jgi:rubrerythrin
MILSNHSDNKYEDSWRWNSHELRYWDRAQEVGRILITVMEMADDMQEIQKATCSSCGTTFVPENASSTLCPSCSANQEHHHSGCGCGH